tara:strand:- start:98893 stop:99117 length:225 start_codon:yes stop_codon:yes gene_type:complete
MDFDKEEELLKAYGKHLRILRHKNDFSQEGLALASGVAISSISRIERGQLNPTLTTLIKIQRALGIDQREIIDF